MDVVDVLRIRAVSGCDEKTIRNYLGARVRGERASFKPVTARRIEAACDALGIVLPPEAP